MTGLTTEVIRAWVKRYGVVDPERTSSGRLYSEEDVIRLRLLHAARELGQPIRITSKLDDEQLRSRLNGLLLSTQTDEWSEYPPPSLGDILRCVARFEPYEAQEKLDQVVTSIGSPRDFVIGVVRPLIPALKELRSTDQFICAQECLLMELLQNARYLFTRQHRLRNYLGRFLLASPSGEEHLTALMGAAIMLTEYPLRVAFSPVPLPFADILHLVRISRSEVILLSIGKPLNAADAQQLMQLAGEIPVTTQLWLGGEGAEALRRLLKGKNTRIVPSFEELELVTREFIESQCLAGDNKSISGSVG